ncbi:ParB/RepB/Spo0J family partition protein [Streptacidiphilus griseoplanus]|uniref:ParB/RepB/Spo0J family partition protein n=1 Tax=Peterkaempfera griseoplana TaxID=66896 RepID=UPI0006E4218D|nr:ParB/RepB/Spo0J family partition protein [Peterkaempfera griseoplana]
MSGRRGLGRGLGALIPPAAGEVEPGRPQGQQPGSQGQALPNGRTLISPGAASPTAVPVLPADRGTVAAKVAAAEASRTGAAPTVAEAPVTPEPSVELAPVAGARFAELPLDAITPNPRQPREVFDEEKLQELVTSIREVGLLQPVVVRQTGTDRYELIMGERRWRASREAGLESIPAIVRATEDEKLLLDALLENLHRAELNALEEAAAYDQLLQDFGCTHEELADRIGRSRSQVSNTLRLLKASPVVQRKLAAGVISAGHARALMALDDLEAQEKLASRINAEGLSVRTVEEMVRGMGQSRKRSGTRPGGRVSPAFGELATRLSDRFETRVKVEVGQRNGKIGKGKIVVEFASVEDLNRILDSLAPGENSLRSDVREHDEG